MGPTAGTACPPSAALRPAPLVDAAARAAGLPRLTRPELLSSLAPMVDIVLPVRDRLADLDRCVDDLYDFLGRAFPLPWRVTIVDTGSTDGTWDRARALALERPGVDAWRMPSCGPGAAIRERWLNSPADIVAYLDLDLAPAHEALLPLVAPLVSGHCDLAVGSRLAPGARARRPRRHELLTIAYNGLLRLWFGTRYTDARCALKAARSEVARPLLGVVADDGRFFDTELLLAAAGHGLRVHEVPVEVPVDPVAGVGTRARPRLAATVRHDLRAMLRVWWARTRGRARVDLPERPAPLPVAPDAVLSPTRAQRHGRRVRRPGTG